MSKKIIFTVTNDLNYDQRMIRICSSLAKAGYEVLLVGRRKRKSTPLKQSPFQQKRLFCFFQKGKLFYLEYNIRLFFFLAFAKCNALCAIDLDTILPVLFAGKLKKKLLIFDAHEYYIESPEIVSRPRVQALWSRVDQYAIPNFKHAYTVCESLAELFKERYNYPFSVIRNVPFKQEPDDPNNISTNNVKILLYQGVLNEGRGLEALIDAMVEVENAALWLTGEGDLSDQLRARVKTKEVEHKVSFLGYVKPAHLPALTAKAYIGFNLLENKGLNYYYSLANKFFDYIQAGVPAINMNFPEYKKLNDQYPVGLLVDDLNVENLAKAINKLLNDSELYNQLKANCATAAAEWNWEKEEKKLIEFYNDILA